MYWMQLGIIIFDEVVLFMESAVRLEIFQCQVCRMLRDIDIQI